MEELTGFGKKRQLKSHSKEQSKIQIIKEYEDLNSPAF